MGCTSSKPEPDLFDSTVLPPTSGSRPASLPDTIVHGPPVLLPNSLGFTPSINGRNGLKPDEVYDFSTKELLGEGTFGRVYKCRHSRRLLAGQNGLDTGEWTRGVAIKIPIQITTLERRAASEYDDVEAQCEELQTLLKLRNVKGVLHLHEYYFAERKLILVTELLGMELSNWMLEQDSFTEKKVRMIATVLIQAIKHLHDHRVCHRDLKLQNILLPANKNIMALKIVDFGLAKELAEGEQATEFCGSYGYMAPEIYQNEPYGFEVDMFAFGVILFRLLSGGDKPFPQKNKRELRRATERLEYDINRQGWENVSESGKKMIKGLLTPNYQRLTAMEAEEEEWCRSSESHMVTVQRPTLDRESTSGAVNLSQRPSAEKTVPGRFWLNSNLVPSLEQVTSRGAYCGKVLGHRGDGDSVLLFVDEMLPPQWKRLPEYVQNIEYYTEADCRALFKKITSALEIFHESKVAHRYLHMENVVVDEQGNLKLTGINYAQLCERPLTGHFGKKFSWFAYHAPEINESFSHDSRVDLWSLGAILYTLLCGIFPFPGSGEVLRENKGRGFIEFEPVIVSPAAQDLVRGLLQPNPNLRMSLDQIWQHEWMLKEDRVLRRQELSLTRVFMSDWMSRTSASMRDSRNMNDSRNKFNSSGTGVSLQ